MTTKTFTGRSILRIFSDIRNKNHNGVIEMTKVEFQTIKTGAAFTSTSGDFVKINECVAKRTEAHWSTSEKTWPFSPIDTVYI